MSEEAVSSDFKVGDHVRSTNRIYRSLGVGRIQKIRGNQCKVQFDPSVFSKPPYRSENKILPLSEIEKIYTPLERLEIGYPDDSWKFEIKTMATRLLTANVGGQLSNARTEILPHQIFTAYKVVSSSIYRFLLADEVGLGKTIEVGIIWQALRQRGLANRTLIVCPAGLTIQWQEEMRDKFGAFFEIFRRDFQANYPRIWDLKHQVIASIDTLKRKEHKAVLLENRKWDMIIFDEAQKLSAIEYDSGRTEKTFNYHLADDLKDYCDCLLLLTATPHQGEENHSRFKNLLKLLSPDVNFKDIPGCEDNGGSIPFYKLILRTPKKSVTDSKGKKVFKGRRTHRLPFVMYDDERAFYQEVENYIRTGYNMLERIKDRKIQLAAGFVLTIFQKMNASSSHAIKGALQTRKEKLLKQPSQKQENESDEYQDSRYQGENEAKEIERNQQFIIENEIQEIDQLLKMHVKRDKKLHELFRLIKRIDEEAPRKEKEKMLIFTEYRRTQDHIVNELEEKYGKGSAVVIHGGMKLENIQDEKEDITILGNELEEKGAMQTCTAKRTTQRLFWEHENVRFLVSTEAGGEGINLQCCHIVVNYDSPWNPMRKEQRIGRVYRYGQDKIVQIYNFYNQGTIEEKVQTYSEDKIERVAEAISRVTHEDPEEIMAALNGQLENQFNPEKIYSGALVEGTLNEQTQIELSEAMERAKRAYELAKTSLFRHVSSYSFDKYQKELATDLSLKDIQELIEQFLKMHHRQILVEDGIFSFLTPDVLKSDNIKDRYTAVTFERDTAMKRSDIDFFAIGHPFVDNMLSYIGSYDFGGLNAKREIRDRNLAGTGGFQFDFIIKKAVAQELGDEYLFVFHSVFLDDKGSINSKALKSAIENKSETVETFQEKLQIRDKFEKVREYLENKVDIWDWEEEVDLINVARVDFR